MSTNAETVSGYDTEQIREAAESRRSEILTPMLARTSLQVEGDRNPFTLPIAATVLRLRHSVDDAQRFLRETSQAEFDDDGQLRPSVVFFPDRSDAAKAMVRLVERIETSFPEYLKSFEGEVAEVMQYYPIPGENQEQIGD